MTLTIIDRILALVPDTEGTVYIANSTFDEVQKILTENKGFSYKWDEKEGWVFTKNNYEDWIVVTGITGCLQVSVSWGHW